MEMRTILFSILSYDVWFYLSHLLLHTRQGYKIHALHHTIRNPRFPDTYVGHWMEGPLQSVGAVIPFLFVEPAIQTAIEFAVVIALLNLRGMMRHDERCVRWIGNHHLLHHKHPSYNFGEYWIDWLCGTQYPNDTEYRRGLFYL